MTNPLQPLEKHIDYFRSVVDEQDHKRGNVFINKPRDFQMRGLIEEFDKLKRNWIYSVEQERLKITDSKEQVEILLQLIKDSHQTFHSSVEGHLYAFERRLNGA